MKKQLGLTEYQPEKAYQGYTLFSPLAQTNVYMVDMRGDVVHRWQVPYLPANYGHLLENGNLLYGGRTDKSPVNFGGRGGILIEVDWEGNILWEYIDDALHHDFRRMDNGNTMLLGWEPVPSDVAKHIKGGNPGTEEESGIWCDYLREITPDGQVAWEWYAYQHLDLAEDSICPLHKRTEWTHSNACQVLPDGNILTSFRLLSTVAIIDKKSGDFLWKWGKGELGHQHDPNMLANGNILIFDNGSHAINAQVPRSRVLEVNPKTSEVVWEYETLPGWDFFSPFVSGAQRLPNGNTLICEGMTGRMFEVTVEGDIVWEYISPYFGDDEHFGRVNMIFRAYRYGSDFPGFRGKNLDPEMYAWLNHLHRP